MYFRRRLLQPEAPSSGGDPRINWEAFCHEATFQEFQKSWKFKISQLSATRSGGTGSQKVAGGVSAHFCLVKTPSIAIWVKIFVLGGALSSQVQFWTGRCPTTLWLPALTRSNVWPMGNTSPQLRHRVCLLLPCTSTVRSGDVPASKLVTC